MTFVDNNQLVPENDTRQHTAAQARRYAEIWLYFDDEERAQCCLEIADRAELEFTCDAMSSSELDRRIITKASARCQIPGHLVPGADLEMLCYCGQSAKAYEPRRKALPGPIGIIIIDSKGKEVG